MAEVLRQFRVPGDPTAALHRAGWTVVVHDTCIEATRGSQWRTRILGGWFVGHRSLPMRVHFHRDTHSHGFEATATSTFGFGYLDRHFRRRYESAFDELESALNVER